MELGYRSMKNGGRRVATATGAMLADPDLIGNPSPAAADTLFDPEFWRARGAATPAGAGRGAAWFIRADGHEWVLRHFRRGGFMARLSQDRYLFTGEAAVRSFAEWRLLAALAERGLPVPRPVAAGYRRHGIAYRCDLITERVPDAEPLSAALARGALSEPAWRAIGAVIARLHRAGVDHADLNAHNILIDAGQRVSVIDFDRGRLRSSGPWAALNVARLHRSLRKLAAGWTSGRFDAQTWNWLMAGYAEE
jgi:3-deoxy-D-manno-octulosonic acid kinase